MKPKNRIMCPAIQRPKMLFETEKEALSFIKFNGSDVGNYLRTYYCEACCGWHITHLQRKKNNTYRDFSKLNLGKKSLVEKAQEKINQKEQRLKKEKGIQELTVLGHIELPQEPTKEDLIQKRKLQIDLIKTLDANILLLSKKKRSTYFRLNGIHITSGLRGLINKVAISFKDDTPDQFVEKVKELYNTYIETGTC